MAALTEVLGGLDLNAGGYFVSERDYGAPTFEPQTQRGARGVPERLLALTHDGSRTITLTIEARGASKDATIALLLALYAKLPKEGNPVNLVVTPTGATNGVTFVCLGLTGALPSPYDLPFDVSHQAAVTVTMLAEPYAYGPEQNVFSGSATVPGYIDLTVPGDFPAPLRVLLNPGTNTVFNTFYAGLLPDQNTAFTALFKTGYGAQKGGIIATGAPGTVYCQAHGLCPSPVDSQLVQLWGMATTPATNGQWFYAKYIDADHFSIGTTITSVSQANGRVTRLIAQDALTEALMSADANCYDGYRAVNGLAESSNYVSYDFDDRAFPVGTYLPLVRWTANQLSTYSHAWLYGIQLTNSSIATSQWAANSSAGYRLCAATPALRLPFYRFGSAGATLRWKVPVFNWATTGAAGNSYLDYLAMLPTSWGWAQYVSDNAGGSVGLLIEYDGTVYDNSVATTLGRSGGLRALGNQRLIIVASDAYSSSKPSKLTASGTIKVVPRYVSWR
jgi:hypothetical protein